MFQLRLLSMLLKDLLEDLAEPVLKWVSTANRSVEQKPIRVLLNRCKPVCKPV